MLYGVVDGQYFAVVRDVFLLGRVEFFFLEEGEGLPGVIDVLL
jgi:hypothetical protein